MTGAVVPENEVFVYREVIPGNTLLPTSEFVPVIPTDVPGIVQTFDGRFGTIQIVGGDAGLCSR
ncbi:MAG: hypothetical protein HC835_22040 [Oscillatoriales cyanobacterium RM2_1_1]|nr:hypothetical protein [Oscillatoriales cyanobacterium RM2_1_1]